jgi:hypothetical protein
VQIGESRNASRLHVSRNHSSAKQARKPMAISRLLYRYNKIVVPISPIHQYNRNRVPRVMLPSLA